MTVVRTDAGWAVLDDDGGVVQIGLETNAAAWRWLDRFNARALIPADRKSQIFIDRVTPWRYPAVAIIHKSLIQYTNKFWHS